MMWQDPQDNSNFTNYVLINSNILDRVLSYLEPTEIQALSHTCRWYRDELTYWFDRFRPRIKGWSTLTEAEARACIEMTSLFEEDVNISYIISIADRIRTYKIDLKTAEHVFRYDLFPMLWFTAMFMPFDDEYPREWLLRSIDKRRQRSKMCQRLTAPYETLIWYCTYWYFKRLWDTMIVEFGKEWVSQVTAADRSTLIVGGKELTFTGARRDGEPGHVWQATPADGSAIWLQGATVVPVQESKKLKRWNKSD
ncbi:hypothetical protein AZE42_08497 [Rhizopogon vesiculosus]|uniref:DUF7079 domain-containing protein n=1 Tax=Rhizopogon vesiculosus TaxID=180088 RepID=A0A1J8R4J0_9AGAM|nr:hypothetical protein AZE42_08497 [Rhizopogon vesiculosus]